MNIIIFDSSSLILMAKINLLKFIGEYKYKTFITKEVYRESVEIGKQGGKSDAFIIEEEIKNRKINISEIKNPNLLTMILKNFKCAKGEAEALSLSIDKKAMLFTDDLESIKICKVYEIDFITTLTFLVKLVYDDKIEKDEALIKFDLLAKYGYYSKKILNYALEECNKKWNK